MSFCTGCGHALGTDDRFCPSCGAAAPGPGTEEAADAVGPGGPPSTPAGSAAAPGPPPGPVGPPPGPAVPSTTVQPAAAAAPPPAADGGPPGRRDRTWLIVGIVAVLLLAGLGGWWLGSRSDDEAADDTTTTTSTSTSTSTTTTSTSTTSTSTTTTTTPTRSWDIGLEWVEDGRAPAPGVVEVAGGFSVELGHGALLVRDEGGSWIWMVAEVGRQEPYAVFRLVDVEPVDDLTETDVYVLGTTACTVGGTPTPGVVGVFTYEDAPQLTQPRLVWVLSPAAGALVDPSGPVVCENEGWGV